MKWINRLMKRTSNLPISGVEYRVTSTLYSSDGKRSAEIREFMHGDTYLLEFEWTEGVGFKPRHEGRLVGPFASPKLAEHFIIATDWFAGKPST